MGSMHLLLCVSVSVNIVLYVHVCVCSFVLYCFGLNNGAPRSFWFNMVANFGVTIDIILVISCYGDVLFR